MGHSTSTWTRTCMKPVPALTVWVQSVFDTGTWAIPVPFNFSVQAHLHPHLAPSPLLQCFPPSMLSLFHSRHAIPLALHYCHLTCNITLFHLPTTDPLSLHLPCH